MSKQSQCTSAAFHPHPTKWQKISPTKNPHGDISQQRGRAIPNTPHHFATPTVFGLQGLSWASPSVTQLECPRHDSTARRTKAVMTWKENLQHWRQWLPQFCQLADKSRRVRLESRQSRSFCCFSCNITLFSAWWGCYLLSEEQRHQRLHLCLQKQLLWHVIWAHNCCRLWDVA